MLEARGVSFHAGSKALVNNVSLALEPGSLCAILGPNGAGKSTLVKLMTGQLKPSAGEITLHGKPLATYDAAALARQRAVLAQSRAVGFPFKAQDVVMMGRHPHVVGRMESETDFRVVESCLQKTDADYLAQRIYNTLSGGESARVDLARVLAQETPILFLDEPTNHLDPKHQVAVLSLCRELADAGMAVAVCMHDLNLAGQFADRALVMKNGATEAFGRTGETLTPQLLRQVYEIPFSVWERTGGGICILPGVEGAMPNPRTNFEGFTASGHNEN